MTIRVLLFASWADAVGAPSVDVSLPAGATVADMVAHVGGIAGVDRVPAHPMVAVNQTYADYGRVLDAGDEVAIIPPVAGG